MIEETNPSEINKYTIDKFIRQPFGNDVASYIEGLIKSKRYGQMGFDNDWIDFHNNIEFREFSEPLVGNDNLLEIKLTGAQTSSGIDHRIIGDVNTWKKALRNAKTFRNGDKEVVVIIVEQGKNSAEAVFLRTEQLINIKDNPLFQDRTD